MSVNSAIRQFLATHAIEIQVLDEFPISLFATDAKIQITVIEQQTKITPSLLEQIRKEANQNGNRFVLIPEELWKTKQELVQNRLLSLWKKRNRILAKDCKIDRVDKDTAATFLENNHFFGTCSAKHRLGLYNSVGELQALATFAKPRLMTQELKPYHSHEWLRYASLSHTTVIGGMGKLLQAFLLETKAEHVMTYADLNWGNGHSFEKLGFKSQLAKTNLGTLMGASMKFTLDLRKDEQTI